MRTIYLDCSMGAAGDMLTAALLELTDDPEAIIRKLNSLGIPGVEFIPEKAVRCGVIGTYMGVQISNKNEGASHSTLPEIMNLVHSFSVPDTVKEDIRKVYTSIAQAESGVHGVPVEQIHFHEVGTLDAVADVTAVCLLIYLLDADHIAASPVCTGTGTVKCAHGILPVPAPATALLLMEMPIYGGNIQTELCTPTGAALIRYFVSEFGPMPPMRILKTGYGMGKKELPQANCIRCFLGEAESTGETVLELSCNIDDMSGEALGFAMEALLSAGALDVYTTPIGMKKSRPGVKFSVICWEDQRENLLTLIFRHTTTLGVRENKFIRYSMKRTYQSVETALGTVR